MGYTANWSMNICTEKEAEDEMIEVDEDETSAIPGTAGEKIPDKNTPTQNIRAESFEEQEIK
ncbi:hypothetical protein AbraIFM66950_011058 [Aspergillus brasiliensis]|nr:hypothetical protein AbraIFM66950_011058 [Aspergillus brasiliensis]